MWFPFVFLYFVLPGILVAAVCFAVGALWFSWSKIDDAERRLR